MDGFKDRVGKVFDCLSSSSSNNNNNTKAGAAWSLSDGEIERNTWNRNKGNKSDIIDDDTILVSSSFHNLFKSNNNNKKTKTSFDDPDDEAENDDLDVRASIGLDPTLDFEDEEDEYDKIATGTENASTHLLYMKDVTNHAPFLNSHHILSNSKPQLNHTLLSTTSTSTNNNNNDNNNDNDDHPVLVDNNALKVKSILKRKTNELDKPSSKRVRFDASCKERDAHELDGFHVAQVFKNQRASVPDYLVNPSKYTRYTFNDEDEKRGNTEAYMDFLEKIRKAKDVGSEEKSSGGAELAKSVVFIPRKKRGDVAACNGEGEVKETANGVVAVAVQEEEVGDMMVQDETDGDGVCGKTPKFQKPSRRYRSKLEDDDTVC